MAKTLAEIRAEQAAQSRVTYRPQENSNSNIFSFKKLKAGDKIRIRFVPDKDDTNDFFWRPLNTRAIKFNSIKVPTGQVYNTNLYVSVPAFNAIKGSNGMMPNLPEDYIYYSSNDVIQQKIKGFWDNTDQGRELYKSFGKKTRYVMQGFVRNEGYEQKLYRFIINKDLFDIIYSFMSDDEIMDMPSDPIKGKDFILNVNETKISLGGVTRPVNDYSTSKWSNNVTPLTEDELTWLKVNGAYDLKQFVTGKPTAVQEEVMLEMFNASYNNMPYDVKAWSGVFKPDNVALNPDGSLKTISNDLQQTMEIPQSQTAFQFVQPQQPIAQQIINSALQQPVRPYYENVQADELTQYGQGNIGGYQGQPQQVPQQVAQPAYQPVAQQTYQPAVQPQVQQTAPQLIKQNTVDVSGASASEVINNIVSRFNLK